MARRSATDSEDTRRAIQEAAVLLFAEKGFAAVGIRDLANHANISTAALYHYMGTKEDLLVDLMDTAISPILAAAEQVLATDMPPAQQLVSIVEAHVWQHATYASSMMVADTEVRALTGDGRRKILKIRDDYQAAWRKVVQRGVTVGAFEVQDLNVATLALIQCCTGVSHWYRPNGRIELAQLCTIYADLALSMVKARSDGAAITSASVRVGSPQDLLQSISSNGVGSLPPVR